MAEFLLLHAGARDHEMFECVLAHKASAVILVHNHPSGDATPSREDVRIAKTVRTTRALIDVRVLDHFIVGEPSCRWRVRAC